MNAEEQSKKLKAWAPYIVVVVLALLMGRLFIGVFTGDSNKPGVVWEEYSETAYQAARQQKKPIMLYFAADWCGPCHKLRRETFTDQDVIAGTDRFVRFKVDLTSPQGEAAKVGENFAVSALPTVVFIGEDGQERVRLRLIGFEEAARFRQRLQAVK